MESTTPAKPRILYTGAPTGSDFNALREADSLCAPGDTDEAEVLWVDCATTKPDQYAPLIEKALGAGKTLVLTHLDTQAHDFIRGVVGTRIEDSAGTVLVTPRPANGPPPRYALTVLDATRGELAPTHAEDAPSPRDWGALIQEHLARSMLTAGGPGLIPPPGVMFGIKTQSMSGSKRIGIIQTTKFGFHSSFHVYRANGKSPPDYVVIRVQQATFAPFILTNLPSVQGHWLYAFQTECQCSLLGGLIATSPQTLSLSELVTHLTVPLHVKYIQDGSCRPQYWSATHGPIARPWDGWNMANRSSPTLGKAEWRYFHRAPWNSEENPLAEFERWKASMYDKPRVKRLNLLADSTLTVETAAAWLFPASVVQNQPKVTFFEQLKLDFVTFSTTPSGSMSHETAFAEGERVSTELDLVALTEDLTNPCR